VSQERLTTERVARELYAARVAGQLDTLCSLFHPLARFRIAGSRDGHQIALVASGDTEIHSWLGILVKTFRLVHYEELSMIIDGARAAVHWRADIHSRITGSVTATELVDLIEVDSGRIACYVEFFLPR
jgi:hypothetical protein